ncbi:MAG TPA: hypothetical protein VMD75_16160 [Candidatus Binataceae bacterium]|nr:hypothetical protein [Candidatus Binataceae bacterium]
MLLSHLFNLLALLLELLLLLLDGLLGLRLLIFVILHLVTDYEASPGAERATNRGSCRRMTYRRADNRTATGA